MRRKEKVVKLKEIFAFKWHHCEICKSEFRFELAFCMPTGGYDHASYAYSCLPDGRHFIKPLYFCNDHTQDEIMKWIPKPPPKNAKMPEEPMPAPPSIFMGIPLKIDSKLNPGEIACSLYGDGPDQ